MDKAAERRARKAAAARARRQNPDVRAREAEALREAARRRRQDPAVREREAEACRLAARRRRQDPSVREREAQASRQRREDPAVREAARLRRQEDLHNVREREAARKRAYRQADPDAVRAREASAKRIRRAQPQGSRLLKLSSAAEYGSCSILASLLAGKGNSSTQCSVPMVSKSSQANLKLKSKSIAVQTQHGRKESESFGKSSRPCSRRLLRGPSDVCQVAGCHGQITSRAAMRLLLGRVTTRDLQVTGCAAASPVQLYKTCRCGLWPRCFASNYKHVVAIPSTSGSETGQCLCVRTSAWDNMQPCLLVWCAHHLTMHSPVWSDL
ncbi:uncharacterized protein LOC144145873 isoform X1 [Haemaphysalis longicornis]